MPSTISTTAPASLTAVKTVAEAATIAATPAAASTPQTKMPRELPTVVLNACRRPPRAALATTSAVAAPGVRLSSAATGTKATSIRSTAGRLGRGRDLGQPGGPIGVDPAPASGGEGQLLASDRGGDGRERLSGGGRNGQVGPGADGDPDHRGARGAQAPGQLLDVPAC